jgi:hypothetical protein
MNKEEMTESEKMDFRHRQERRRSKKSEEVTTVWLANLQREKAMSDIEVTKYILQHGLDDMSDDGIRALIAALAELLGS